MVGSTRMPARAGKRESSVGSVALGKQMVMGRGSRRRPGMKKVADLESAEGLDKPRNVVLVRVAEHDDIDPSRMERQVRTDPTQRELRIRTAVDEHRRAARRLHQDRVSLADVEDGHVQEPVGPRRDRDDDRTIRARRRW